MGIGNADRRLDPVDDVLRRAYLLRELRGALCLQRVEQRQAARNRVEGSRRVDLLERGDRGDIPVVRRPRHRQFAGARLGEVELRRVAAAGAPEARILLCIHAAAGIADEVAQRAARRAEVVIDGIRSVDLVAERLDLQQRLEIAGRLPQQLRAAGEIFRAVVLLPGQAVVDIAVRPARLAAEAQAERVADRRGDIGAGVEAAMLHLAADPRFRLEIARRAAGDDADRASIGVLAEQRALRAAHHLDPFDVEERHLERARTAGIDAVDEQADRLLERQVAGAGAEAADGDRVIAVGVVDLEIGHRRLEIGEQAHALIRHRLAVDNADGDRNLLKRLLLLGGRHDDLGRIGFLRGTRRSGLRMCRGGHRQHRAAGQKNPQMLVPHHVSPPLARPCAVTIGAAPTAFGKILQLLRVSAGGGCPIRNM